LEREDIEQFKIATGEGEEGEGVNKTIIY